MIITKFSQLDMNRLYTYVDYFTWKFEERVELIKGKIFKMSPAPSTYHQRIAITLSSIVWQHFRKKPCSVFEAPFDVRLPIPKENKTYTVVQPDLCIICDKTKIDEHGCNGAPDLVVEILSPGNTKKEMKDKFEVYEEVEIKEYWLIEPNDKVVFVYILNEKKKYIGLKPYTEDEMLKSTIFNDLVIPLKEIFETD